MLRYPADVRTLAFVAVFFILEVGAWMATSAPLWLIALNVVALSLFAFFGAVITHNTVHVPIFKNRSMNKMFQVVLTLVYGHPVSMFVPGHNLSHHMHTQRPRDAMRTHKLRYRWNLLNVLLFTSKVTPGVLKGNIEYARNMRTRNPRWFKQMVLEAGVLIALMAVLLVLDWKMFLLYVIIPHQFAQWGIVAINFPQHDGTHPDPDHPYDHSRNFVGQIVNWWTFNNGFHGMHHMRPNAHWSLLREYHDKELSPYIHPNLEMNSLAWWCFTAFIWPGKRIDYLGNPVVLPELEPDEPWVSWALKNDVDAEHLGSETPAVYAK